MNIKQKFHTQRYATVIPGENDTIEAMMHYLHQTLVFVRAGGQTKRQRVH